MDIQTTLKNATHLLTASSPTARLDADILLCHILQVNTAYLYAHGERTLTPAQQANYEAFISRRQTGEPIAYITGQKAFWSMDFKVNANTLIPRPETELLVELTLALLPANETQWIADLGTGCGAIALALAKERPIWKIFAIDDNRETLSVTEDNRVMHLLTNVTCLQSDWCEAIKNKPLDAIVSNPPYIAPNCQYLEPAVALFEPKHALIAEDEGLSEICTIARQAMHCLKPGGKLVLEHGFQQSASVKKILAENHYQNIRSHLDINAHERATTAEKPIDPKSPI